MKKFFAEHDITTLDILYNNAFFYGDHAICGTRGWFYEEDAAGTHTGKMLAREALRLEASLKAAEGKPIYCFLHYPPIYQGYKCPEMLELLDKYEVERCYYGHLHGYTHRRAFEGMREKTEYALIAADYVAFQLEKSRVAVTVEVGAEEFEAAVAKAYAKARGKLSIPGFRPGKAPRKMIEKLYGAGVFYSDAVDIALPEAYTQAIGQSGLDVVGYPEIEIVDDKIDENGFTFKATVAVYPEVKLGEYKGLTAEKEEIKVSADDVKERLNEMAERNARLVSVDRKAKKGDIAVIDFEGFDNGEAFEGGKGENYELELGSGSFVPGFEDQVIGMKAGEEKDLDITFPEDYHKDLAGKKVVFHVKAKEIKCKELPKLDDDFAKDVSEYDTLKELKDSIKREITEQREQSAKYAVENELMEKVAANIECDIPDALIDEQCARFLEEFKQRLQSQGIPYDQYCKMTNMDEAKFLEEGKEPATRQVRMDLAVNAIIKEEKLEATDEEVEKQYNDLAEKYSMDVNELKKYLDAMSVRTQIIRDKAISVVVDSAKIEKKKAPKKEAEGEAAEGEEKPAKKTAAKKSAKKEEEKAE